MFKKHEAGDFNDAETIIGPSVKVEGDFIGEGNLIVEGIIKGKVETAGNLKIGAKAVITASITAANALIAGEVQGDVHVQNDLELTDTARITGDIQAQSICIARGATLNGTCSMRSVQSVAQSTSSASAKAVIEPAVAE